jgi:hypothetical protein
MHVLWIPFPKRGYWLRVNSAALPEGANCQGRARAGQPKPTQLDVNAGGDGMATLPITQVLTLGIILREA